MTPSINIDGSQVSGVTIDGTDVKQVTVDGATVFSEIREVDRFERSNPLNDYSGSTGDFAITTSGPLEGSQSLTPTSYSNDIGLQSVVLDALPSQGDVFSVLIEDNDGSSKPTFLFGLSTVGVGSGDYYEAVVSSLDNSIQLNVRDNGSRSTLDSDTPTVSTGAYEVEITWQSNDTIEMRVFNFDVANSQRGSQVGATVSATDSTHSNADGIGFRADGNGPVSSGDLLLDRYQIGIQGGV